MDWVQIGSVLADIAVIIIVGSLAFLMFLTCIPQYFFSRHLKKLRKLSSETKKRVNYFLYTIKCEFHAQKIKFIFTFIKKLSPWVSFAVLIVGPFTRNNYRAVLDTIFNYSTIFLLVGWGLLFYDFIENLSSKFTTIKSEPSAYADVDAPNGWKKHSLQLGTSIETIYTSDDIDSWLLGSTEINAKRDREYETKIKEQIYNTDNWKKVYHPFLRRKYLEATYDGKLFHNEAKFGISVIDSDNNLVHVHRTCYYDSYLTNIIPGKKLVLNEDDGQTIAKTNDLMPYVELNGGAIRKLEQTYDKSRASEPGISTILIVDGKTNFWTQSNSAQSSVGRIAPSGSGSADWNDCKRYLKDKNGFRKAVVYGMQRELWEEAYSFSTTNMNRKQFMNSAETRIIGCFRWLQKAGKTEFVGITRFHTATAAVINNAEANPDELNKKPIPFEIPTIGKTLSNLPKFDFPKDEDDVLNLDVTVGNEHQRYSIPCAMAIAYLREECRKICDKCPNKNYPDCQKSCKKKTEDALFPEGSAVRLG